MFFVYVLQTSSSFHFPKFFLYFEFNMETDVMCNAYMSANMGFKSIYICYCGLYTYIHSCCKWAIQIKEFNSKREDVITSESDNTREFYDRRQMLL